MILYSVRDKKSTFMLPFDAGSDPEAVRAFSFSLFNANGITAFAPGDFDLYKIGEFDVHSGTLVPLPIPTFVIDGLSAQSIYARQEVPHE